VVRVNEGHIPDQLERRIRFGYRFLASAVLGVVGALFRSESLRVPIAVGAGTALLFGVLARRYGDRF
jgi:hypothetical protein